MRRLFPKLRRAQAARLAILGGVLLFLGGASGSATIYVLVLDLLARLVPALGGPALLFAHLLTLLAALGGVTVIVGGALLRSGRRRVGLFLVDVGAGLGLVGVILIAATALVNGQDPLAKVGAAFDGLAGAGLALTLVVRLGA